MSRLCSSKMVNIWSWNWCCIIQWWSKFSANTSKIIYVKKDNYGNGPPQVLRVKVQLFFFFVDFTALLCPQLFHPSWGFFKNYNVKTTSTLNRFNMVVLQFIKPVEFPPNPTACYTKRICYKWNTDHPVILIYFIIVVEYPACACLVVGLTTTQYSKM